jgi:dCMP deaminase
MSVTSRLRRKEEAILELDALIALASLAASKSPNRRRQVGAAILTCDGLDPITACNTFPNGVAALDWRNSGDERLVWMEHAERNAIFAAAKLGRALSGATIASTFFPCIDCARAIVQTGIVRLLSPEPELDDPVWGSSFPRSRVILEEGGVELVLRPISNSWIAGT